MIGNPVCTQLNFANQIKVEYRVSPVAALRFCILFRIMTNPECSEMLQGHDLHYPFLYFHQLIEQLHSKTISSL